VVVKAKLALEIELFFHWFCKNRVNKTNRYEKIQLLLLLFNYFLSIQSSSQAKCSFLISRDLWFKKAVVQKKAFTSKETPLKNKFYFKPRKKLDSLVSVGVFKPFKAHASYYADKFNGKNYQR
jgi:hypothetical protein